MIMTITTTTRASELTAILEFAKDNGYEGSTAKLEKMLKSFASSGKAREENAACAIKIAELMEPGEFYFNADVRKMPIEFPITSRGQGTVSKVSAIMRAGVAEGIFTSRKIGSATAYELA